jgi:predicted O-linked N-acetylglucosamine transferase (SPINDLY family)
MVMNPTQRLLQEAMSLHQAGKLPQAAARYAQLRTVAPSSFEAHYFGGQVALSLGQHAQALALFERAVILNARSPEAAVALGVTRLATGNAEGAEKPLRDAVKLQPGNANVWDKLALVVKMKGRYEEALECHRKAVAAAPKNASYWYAFGASLSLTNAFDEALACHEKAIALDPRYAPAHLGRATALHKMHRIPEALDAFDRAIALDPRDEVGRSYRLLDLNYLSGLSREAVWAEHQAYGRLVTPAHPRSFAVDRNPDRRLRVGFLSPDLRAHPVACFLEPLLRHVDHSRYEIFLYHDHQVVDAVSERFRSLCDHWCNLAGQINEIAEAAILADKPDVMVDLAGHTGLNRLALFARRLAPVQLSYLGYPNTTGIEAMDYRFVDAITDPSDRDQAFHSERLVRFSPCAWAFDPPSSAPEPGPDPRLASGRPSFGSFNNFAKVGDDLLRCWARLLALAPEARLFIKAPGLSSGESIRSRVEDRLARAGLPADRVVLLERTPSTAEHLALYNQIDVALDSWPYNGTTTTCEALWMGVPVVALAGDRHAGRVGESLLRAVGHDEWVAADVGAYVEKALSLVKAPAQSQPRTQLRDALRKSPLLDHKAQSERFFAAVRRCWQGGVS